MTTLVDVKKFYFSEEKIHDFCNVEIEKMLLVADQRFKEATIAEKDYFRGEMVGLLKVRAALTDFIS